MEDREMHYAENEETTPRVVYVQAPQTVQKSGISIKLDKVGKIILIVTMILFIGLLVPGIVLSVPNRQSRNNNHNYTYTTLYLGTTYYESSAEEGYYYYKYTQSNQSSSERLYIMVDGGDIYSISAGSQDGNYVSTYYTSGALGFETVEYFYPSNNTYYIKVYADGNSDLKIKVTNYLN